MKEPRVCGSCTACCTLLRIDSAQGYSTRLDNAEDIAKPAGQPCRYLTPEGCGIYEVRPLLCRKFKCDWLLGRMGFADAPPKVGYLGNKGRIFLFNRKIAQKNNSSNN